MLIYNIYIPCSVTLTKIAQSFGYEVSFPAISKYKKKEREGKEREGKMNGIQHYSLLKLTTYPHDCAIHVQGKEREGKGR